MMMMNDKYVVIDNVDNTGQLLVSYRICEVSPNRNISIKTNNSQYSIILIWNEEYGIDLIEQVVIYDETNHNIVAIYNNLDDSINSHIILEKNAYDRIRSLLTY